MNQTKSNQIFGKHFVIQSYSRNSVESNVKIIFKPIVTSTEKREQWVYYLNSQLKLQGIFVEFLQYLM